MMIHNPTQTIQLIIANEIQGMEFLSSFRSEFKVADNQEACIRLMFNVMNNPDAKTRMQKHINSSLSSFIMEFADDYPINVIRLIQVVQPEHFADRIATNEALYSVVPKYLSLLNNDNKKIMYEIFIKASVTNWNILLLNYLHNFDTDLFKEYTINLSQEEREKIIKMLDVSQHNTTDSLALIMKYMPQFTKGFDKENHITYKGALLTCAQIEEQKTYPFMVTVLNGKKNEFTPYFDILKSSDFPLREKFIISSGHWVTGEILFDESSKPTMYILDSLGVSKNFPLDFIKEFKNKFPDGEVYFSEEKRQANNKACPVFVLDDIVHLHTIEKYLLPIYQNSILSYIKKHVVKEKEIDGIKVKLFKMPLPLLRTTQSKGLLSDLFPRRALEDQDNLERKINKNNKSMIESMRKSIKNNINLRIHNRLDKIAKSNLNYLLSTDIDVLKNKMKKFTLSGFKERMLTARYSVTKKI
ncbi:MULTISPECIES: hypothetical protein [unclassified Legionella]|uniref:hypothetical protein n=1 Tax=unclassified Legionella TaxID=2622702 RepID=UPI001056CA26|nr:MULTISPECIES: hypothetical protein [unclassified Legionella]MDI9819665.1 hypothetical protein [Legionella sp. PL877]